MWGSSVGLIFCLSIGILISLVSNNIFLVWFGLELNMFGIIPFINSSPNQTNNILFLTPQEVNVSFFYFFVQVIGSLLFAWGGILSDWYIVSIIGLTIKVGVAPFFWWVPPLLTRLDWLSIGVVSTIQKIPAILLIRLVFDLNLEICLLFSVLGFLVATVGINFSSNNLKQLIAWSSISNMSILVVLIVLNNSLGLLYYVFYSVLVLIFCICLNFTNSDNLCNSFINGENENINTISSLLLLVFSGLPPLVSFLLKIFFLSGFFLNDCSFLIMDIDMNGNSISFFYLLGSYLNSWNIVTLYISLIILQSIGYIKAFISINSSKYSRLNIISNSVNNTNKIILISLGILYFISLILIWL
uniref:NADH-ubiquinone oxidoreductase chain 2 n=1 Tax=Discocelis tigrina TaxID=52060 RepID=A0A2R3SK30_9PLAT|nr:NADH dehydrogenase subunit 2 [Discocelis tigrina]